MKHIAQSLTLALAALAVSTSAPRAGEWVGSGGVIKDYQGTKDFRNAAVPVPAPRPAPIEKAEWYLRGDIGYMIANHQEYKIQGPFFTGRDNDDAGDTAFGGIGFGRYITPGWRVDFTTDFKPKRRVAQSSDTFLGQIPVSGTVRSLYDVAQHDSGSITNYSGLVNVYRDLERHGAITPYFGVGAGFSMQQLQFNMSQTAECVGDEDLPTGVITPGCTSQLSPNPGGSKGTITWGFALAAIAGFSLDVMPGVKMDSSYRLMYEGVTGSVKSVANDGTKFSVTDGLEHALRTGVRIDLN